MIFTKHEVLTETACIWAFPRYSPKAGEFPFYYELKEGTTHWNSRAIMVAEIEVKAVVPEGIDLYSRALETLNLQEKEAMRVYSEKMVEIAQVRKSMLLLDAPKAAPAEGEYIPAPTNLDDDGIPY